MVRFFLITDIHYGVNRRKKLGSQAPELLSDFTKAANQSRADFIVDMGDRVNATNKKEDAHFMRKVRSAFNRLAAPVFSVIGNHDVTYLSRQDNEDIMGCPANSYSRDVGDYHLVFFNPGLELKKYGGLRLREEDLQWLENDLESTDKKVLLFSHVPLDNQQLDDQVALERDGHPYISYYNRADELRGIMERSGKVVACFSGHHHRNKHSVINGIHYITHQSLVERQEEDRSTPRNAYSMIEINDDILTITGHGHEQPSRTIQLSKDRLQTATVPARKRQL